MKKLTPVTHWQAGFAICLAIFVAWRLLGFLNAFGATLDLGQPFAVYDLKGLVHDTIFGLCVVWPLALKVWSILGRVTSFEELQRRADSTAN
jgi:hypothetical protein